MFGGQTATFERRFSLSTVVSCDGIEVIRLMLKGLLPYFAILPHAL